jgi:hypothetical protein
VFIWHEWVEGVEVRERRQRRSVLTVRSRTAHRRLNGLAGSEAGAERRQRGK